MKNKVVVKYLSSFQFRIQIYVEKFTKEKLLFLHQYGNSNLSLRKYSLQMFVLSIPSIWKSISYEVMKITHEQYEKKNVFQSSRDNPMMTKQRVIILTRVLRKLCGISAVLPTISIFIFFKKKSQIELSSKWHSWFLFHFKL